MLPDVFQRLVKLSGKSMTVPLLDVVLCQLQGKLSNEETIRYVQAVNWDMIEIADVLKYPIAQYWSTSALRLLSIAQTSAQHRRCDKISDNWTVLDFQGRLADLRGGAYWDKEINYKRCKFRIRLGEPSSTQCSSYGFPHLALTLSLRKVDQVPDRYLDRKVTVRLGVITKCRCLCAAHRNQDISADIDNLTIACFVNRGKVQFDILKPREFESFLWVHNPSCGVVLRLSMEI